MSRAISGNALLPPSVSSSPDPAQMPSWVSATRPMPMTLPVMNSVGVTDDMSTSTMRELFSSMTPVMMAEPQMRKVR